MSVVASWHLYVNRNYVHIVNSWKCRVHLTSTYRILELEYLIRKLLLYCNVQHLKMK